MGTDFLLLIFFTAEAQGNFLVGVMAYVKRSIPVRLQKQKKKPAHYTVPASFLYFKKCYCFINAFLLTAPFTFSK